MTYYSRKSPRIPIYDYSTPNYYFITVCAHNRKCIFGMPEQLNDVGRIVDRHIMMIGTHYQNVVIDKYVVMPNHIHMILILKEGKNHQTVSQIIGQFKSGATREIRNILPGIQVWQRSFHDHVIRNQAGYEKIWAYIEGNPMNWHKDCFYMQASQF